MGKITKLLNSTLSEGLIQDDFFLEDKLLHSTSDPKAQTTETTDVKISSLTAYDNIFKPIYHDPTKRYNTAIIIVFLIRNDCYEKNGVDFSEILTNENLIENPNSQNFLFNNFFCSRNFAELLVDLVEIATLPKDLILDNKERYIEIISKNIKHANFNPMDVLAIFTLLKPQDDGYVQMPFFKWIHSQSHTIFDKVRQRANKIIENYKTAIITDSWQLLLRHLITQVDMLTKRRAPINYNMALRFLEILDPRTSNIAPDEFIWPGINITIEIIVQNLVVVVKKAPVESFPRVSAKEKWKNYKGPGGNQPGHNPLNFVLATNNSVVTSETTPNTTDVNINQLTAYNIIFEQINTDLKKYYTAIIIVFLIRNDCYEKNGVDFSEILTNEHQARNPYYQNLLFNKFFCSRNFAKFLVVLVEIATLPKDLILDNKERYIEIISENIKRANFNPMEVLAIFTLFKPQDDGYVQMPFFKWIHSQSHTIFDKVKQRANKIIENYKTAIITDSWQLLLRHLITQVDMLTKRRAPINYNMALRFLEILNPRTSNIAPDEFIWPGINITIEIIVQNLVVVVEKASVESFPRVSAKEKWKNYKGPGGNQPGYNPLYFVSALQRLFRKKS